MLIGMVTLPKFPKIACLPCLYLFLKNEVGDEVDFLHGYKHQSFLQVDFNTLGIKVSYQVILPLLMRMIKYSQSTQSNKFAISIIPPKGS